MGKIGEKINSSVPTRNMVNQATTNMAAGNIGILHLALWHWVIKRDRPSAEGQPPAAVRQTLAGCETAPGGRRYCCPGASYASIGRGEASGSLDGIGVWRYARFCPTGSTLHRALGPSSWRRALFPTAAR